MRYGTESRLSPDEVLDRARAFFGTDGEAGLSETSGGPGSVTFGSEAGGVSVSAVVGDDKTDVTVLSREHDFWAEKFIRDLR